MTPPTASARRRRRPRRRRARRRKLRHSRRQRAAARGGLAPAPPRGHGRRPPPPRVGVQRRHHRRRLGEVAPRPRGAAGCTGCASTSRSAQNPPDHAPLAAVAAHALEERSVLSADHDAHILRRRPRRRPSFSETCGSSRSVMIATAIRSVTAASLVSALAFALFSRYWLRRVVRPLGHARRSRATASSRCCCHNRHVLRRRPPRLVAATLVVVVVVVVRK